MKTQNETLLRTIENSTLQTLTTVISETIAKVKQEKYFSAADLWNIQRNRRLVRSRRSLV